MDFASTTTAAENRTRWKKHSCETIVLPQLPFKVLGQNRTEQNKKKTMLIMGCRYLRTYRNTSFIVTFYCSVTNIRHCKVHV